MKNILLICLGIAAGFVMEQATAQAEQIDLGSEHVMICRSGEVVKAVGEALDATGEKIQALGAAISDSFIEVNYAVKAQKIEKDGSVMVREFPMLSLVRRVHDNRKVALVVAEISPAAGCSIFAKR